MTEPTQRDKEVYALLLSNRGRVTDLAAYREELLAASAQSAEAQEAEAQRHEIRFIDATPDEGYIRRILEAYIDDSYYSDNTAGLPPENEVCKMMNKWREERNTLLRNALARLASKPSRSEAPVPDEDIARIPRIIEEIEERVAEAYRAGTLFDGVLLETGDVDACLAALKYRLATARPSREEAPDLRTALDLLGEIMSYAETWANLPQNLRNRAEAYLHPYDTGEKKARPSREEEMREAAKKMLHELQRVNRVLFVPGYTEDSIMSGDIEEAVKAGSAALAQGGARDEGEGKR